MYRFFLSILVLFLASPVHAQSTDDVWANYDFTPGDTILFYHDFEGTRVGNFPSRLEYVAGTMEVVELDGNRTLRAGGDQGGDGCFTIPLGGPLPERMTLEFRVRTSDPQARTRAFVFSGTQDYLLNCRYPEEPYAILTGYQGAGLAWDGGEAQSPTERELIVDTWADVRIAKDGDYWKMYVNERRVANVPRFEFPEVEALYVRIVTYRESVFIDDIRVAEGGPRSLYDDLMANGVLITQGIYFDTGQATLKPESTPTLLELADVLNAHADLRLRIEGHTDNTSTDAINDPLSQARAEAVVAYLVEQGIASDRLTASGHGSKRPLTGNDTAEGRAQNRRVEAHVVEGG